jgi:GH15 family glucan-1,4-alpha-glucosidase
MTRRPEHATDQPTEAVRGTSDSSRVKGPRLEDLGLIGNCQFCAHVWRGGHIVWSCLPRFDSEPVFASLLDDDDGGRFVVAPADGSLGEQLYLPNTNVLETTFRTDTGAFRVIDFAPRFVQHQRSFRPTMMVRIVEVLEGTPMVRVACEPRLGWSKAVPRATWGSHHVDFEGFPSRLRLTTDIPLSYLDGKPFALSDRRHLVLTWGAPVEEPLAPLCERFLAETVRYWQGWVKHCNIPPLYQDEVIRSALVLKLHCFEDTGAIVAATTTSIPEAPGSGRNWDYRYCWLRDSYYVLGALRLLGHFEEREQFTQYLINVCAQNPSLDLQPLYRIDAGADLTEHVLEHWPGYRGDGPVRIGNGAAHHQQNDIFGEMVLALAPIFFDHRFRAEQTQATLALCEQLAQKAIAVAGTPDAGIWEVRNAWRPQTFSSLMCWAGADRMARIAARHAPLREQDYLQAAERIRAQILDNAMAPGGGHLVATYGGDDNDLDAALLQKAPLRFLPRDDPRLTGTIDAIVRELAHDGWLFRYRRDDGLGTPEVAFVLCTHWLVEALAATGRKDEANAVFTHARSALSPLGLISEDFDTRTQQMWGNFPQAYSHVGLIHAAFRASPPWSEVL